MPGSLEFCDRTPRPDTAGLTVGNLAIFSNKQAADLEICDAKRAALLSIVEAVNKANEPKKPWWQIW